MLSLGLSLAKTAITKVRTLILGAILKSSDGFTLRASDGTLKILTVDMEE